MLIFKTKLFHRWARRVKLNNESLKQAIDELLRGQYEADLGSHLYKKRIGIHGKGKRGSISIRTIIAVKKGDKCFFLYGYTKNDRKNINEKEKCALMELAQDFLNMDKETIRLLIDDKELTEV